MTIIIIAFFIIIIDQLSKIYIQNTMSLGLSIPVIDDVFHITYILNPGAAFGLLEHQRLFFIAVAAALVIATAYFYRQLCAFGAPVRYGAGLLVGGAVGNLIDRIDTGYVVDFFDFRVWPIFNIADIAIVIGVSLIIYELLFETARGE